MRTILLLLTALIVPLSGCNPNWPVFGRVIIVGDSNASAICSGSPCVPWDDVLANNLAEHPHPLEAQGVEWSVVNTALPGSGLFAPGFFGPITCEQVVFWTENRFDIPTLSWVPRPEPLNPGLVLLIQVGGNDVTHTTAPEWRAALETFIDCALETLAPFVIVNTAPALNSNAPLSHQVGQSLFQAEAWDLCNTHPLAEGVAESPAVFCGVNAFLLYAPPPHDPHLAPPEHAALGEDVTVRLLDVLGF